MKKIPTIFKRNPENMGAVLNEQNPDCLWVFLGDGYATRKFGGTCCMIKDGVFYKRRMVKRGKSIPDGFIEEEFDSNTGKRFGWVLVTAKDKWHMEAIRGLHLSEMENGTYELIGPKIQGNPDDFTDHILLNHKDAAVFPGVPLGFHGLKEYLRPLDIEGFVFHHPDGRMGKIKKRDFGLKRT